MSLSFLCKNEKNSADQKICSQMSWSGLIFGSAGKHPRLFSDSQTVVRNIIFLHVRSIYCICRMRYRIYHKRRMWYCICHIRRMGQMRYLIFHIDTGQIPPITTMTGWCCGQDLHPACDGRTTVPYCPTAGFRNCGGEPPGHNIDQPHVSPGRNEEPPQCTQVRAHRVALVGVGGGLWRRWCSHGSGLGSLRPPVLSGLGGCRRQDRPS